MSRIVRGRPAPLALLCALVLWGALIAPVEAAEPAPFLVVSRNRVLSEIEAAKRLAGEEAQATERLQGEIDEVKSDLNAQEEELARLRSTLPREEFDKRAEEFDQRVRQERRQAQSRAAVLQKVFQDARRKLVDALGTVIEQVRQEAGVRAIMNADAALALDPSIDATDRVIDLFNRTVPVPVVKIPEPPAETDAPADAPDGDAPPTAPEQQSE